MRTDSSVRTLGMRMTLSVSRNGNSLDITFSLGCVKSPALQLCSHSVSCLHRWSWSPVFCILRIFNKGKFIIRIDTEYTWRSSGILWMVTLCLESLSIIFWLGWNSGFSLIIKSSECDMFPIELTFAYYWSYTYGEISYFIWEHPAFSHSFHWF